MKPRFQGFISNFRKLSGWISREGIECYRLYDADMPEYAVAVDVYGQRLNVSEYKAPSGVDKQGAEARLSEVLQVLPKLFSIPASAIVLKQRHRQRKGAQYQKKETAKGELFSIDEHGAKFLINLNDYIDTGLFLDHRQTLGVFLGRCGTFLACRHLIYSGGLRLSQ